MFQEVQPHMALRDRPQLWFLRDTRDQAFHLLLLGTGAVPKNDVFRKGRLLVIFGFFKQILRLNYNFWVDLRFSYNFIWGFLHFCYLHFWYQETYLSFGFPTIEQNQVRESWSHWKADSFYLKTPVELHRNESRWLPSWELTYPPKMAIWRCFSFSQGGIC